MAIHYFDNAATTKVTPKAAEAAFEMMTNGYGNPSSLHKFGVSAAKAVKTSREIIAKTINCQPEELHFTSGGSESNNTAIFGAAKLGKRSGKHVITTEIEHHAVLNPVKELEALGFEVTRIKPLPNGMIDINTLKDAVRQDTILVSMMLVNNETGVINEVSKIRSVLKEKNYKALIHTDAVQALFKVPIDVKKLDVDMMSFSGHKINAPKGIGALYVRRGVKLPPLIYGGGQENGFRSGTEPVPMIAAFGEACAEGQREFKDGIERVTKLREYIINKLQETVPAAHINFTDNCVPHILSISLPGCPSEVTMRILESMDVYVSAGSACSRGKRSHVMTACGVDSKLIESSIRVSMSRHNTIEDADALCEALKSAYARLHR